MLNPLFQIATIAVASFCAQWLAWRMRLPAIVFLLGVGLVVGPMAGLVVPSALLGDLLQPLVGVAVAIILFEGSLQLRFKEIRDVRRTVIHLVIAGATLGWAMMTLAAHYIGGLSWPVATTFAGLLVVTGPTVIMPLLRHSKIQPRTSSLLKWEGIINDPIGVILAVLSYEYFVLTHGELTPQAFFFGEMGTLLIAIGVVSYLMGWGAAVLLERGVIPEYLKAPFLIAVVIGVFALCNVVLHESGLIAVTILGMTLTNKHVASIEEIRKFKETISVLLISGVFILLTANLSPKVLLSMDWRGVLFVLMVVFLIRPLTVMLASIGTKMERNEVLLVGWLAPRGIVCAAVAGIMGPLLVNAGFADGDKLLPLAFGVVLVTVTLHGLTAKPLARSLGLAGGKAEGLLIVGANPWTLQLAEVLHKQGIPVRVADKNWYNLKPVRLANIPFYYGEILSEEAEFDVELSRYSTLLAATEDHVYNALLCNEFAAIYSRENVFQMAEVNGSNVARKNISTTRRGRFFLDEEFDFFAVDAMFDAGWRFRMIRMGAADKMEENPVTDTEEQYIAGVLKSDGTFRLSGAHMRHGQNAGEGDKILVFARREKEQSRQQAA